MFKRFKVTGINENPKKPKRNLMKYLALGCVMALPAFALLKTGVLSMNKNVLVADKNKYDIVADLDGGKFEMGTTPEFTKMDNGNWLYKYKPVPTPTKLPVPVKDGYDFTGWMVSAKPDIQKEYSIPAWHKGNLNVKANWKASKVILMTGEQFRNTLEGMNGFANVTEIRFIKGTPNPNGVNVAVEGEAKAYIEGDILTIASEREIFANKDCSRMFYRFGDYLSRNGEQSLNTKINRIIFDNFITSNIVNMSGMFYQCSSLTVIDVSNFSTSNVTDMSELFDDCRSLTSLDLSSFNTINVINMSRLFEDCSSLTSLDVSSFDTSRVTNMVGIFSHCSSLTSLDVSSFDTSNVTSMNGMFEYCKSLTSLDVSSFNTINVTNMCSMFEGCKSLTSLDVSSFDTSNVTMMTVMFRWCDSLTSLDLSGFDTSNVTVMLAMFEYCKSLTSLDVSSFDTSNVTMMMNMFGSCEKLTSLDVSSFNTSSVTDMSGMFGSCKSLTSLDVSSFNTSSVTDMSGMFGSCKSLTSLDVSSFSTSSVTGMRFMFENCVKLNGSITIMNPNMYRYYDVFNNCASDPNAEFIVKYISPETKEMARKMVNTKNSKDNVYLYEDSSTLLDGPAMNTKLKGISGYTKIEFIKASPKSGIDLSAAQDKSITAYVENNILKVACIGDIYTGTDASNMFMDLRDVTDIKFDNFSSSRATNISNMFKSCVALESIDLSKLNTSKVTQMKDLLCGCKALTQVDISPLDTSAVTNMRGIFYDCDGLTTLDLNQLNTSKVTDMGFIVAECDNLTSIKMDKLNVSNVTSIRHIFKYCRSLENVVLPKFDFTKIKDTEQAFGGCTKLSGNITINGSVTTAYSEMFYGCSSDSSAKFVVSYTNGNKTLAQNMVNTKTANDNVYLNEHVKVKYVFKSSDGSILPSEILNILPSDTNIYGTYINDVVPVKNPSKTSITVSNNKYTFSGYDKDVNFKILSNMIKGDSDKYVDIVGTWKKEATIPVIQGETLIPGPEFNSELGIGQDSIYHIEFRKVSSMSGISGIDVSAKHNNSIIAYKPNSTTYYIVSTKKILANKDASNMFNTTYKTLQTLDLTNFDIGQSENIESMFDGQETLTEIKNIENMHTYHVKNMDTTFYYCSSLRRLDLSKWNTANVTSMRGTFGACGASTINVANWNTSSCTNMRSTFMNMENLTSLDLSGWDTSKAKDISSFISRSTNLSTVTGNIKLGVINDAMWLIKEMPNIRCTITATDSYNSSSFSSSYSGMIRNSTNGSGRVNINYTSNARTLASEIVSDSRSGSSPNVYLGSQISSVSMRNVGDKLPVTKRVSHVVSSKGDTRALNDYELNRKVGEKSFMKISLNNTLTTYAAAHQNAKPVATTRQVIITLNNGSMAMYPVQKVQIPSGKIGDLAKPDLNPKYAGQFGGYFYDKNCTIPVKPNDVVTQDIELYAKW